MKFIFPFKGVPAGEVYPVDYAPGDDCPDDLLPAAIAVGAVEDKAIAAPSNKALKAAPKNKGA